MILYTLLILVLLTLAYMRFEASNLKVETVRFTKSAKHLKVIHLSDIHIDKLKVSVKKIQKAVQKEKPDLIIISGDYIERRENIPSFMDFMKLISGIAPIYLCLGNHDYEAFKGDEKGLQNYMDRIKQTGAHILHNSSVCIEKNSNKYNLIGIADMRYGHHDVGKALSSCCPDAFMNIAFSHNPDIVLQIPDKKVDYLFCGHFHGGQIWAPFNLEFTLMRKEKLCKMGIRKGLHKVNGINIYVNRGLGNVVVPLRFMSRPEIAVFYFD